MTSNLGMQELTNQAEFLGRLVDFRFVGGNEEIIAVFGREPREFKTNAGRSAGNDGEFACLRH